VLAAALEIPESLAVVNIGAPASPEHVIRQIANDVSEIESKGESVVALAGRQFRIERQFVEDLRAHPLTERIAGLKKVLLIFYAPFDDTVTVE